MLTDRQFNVLLDDFSLPYENGTSKLYDYQKYIINDWKKHPYNALINARQTGSTTMIVVGSILDSLLNDGRNVIIFNKQSQAINIIKLIEKILDVNDIDPQLITPSSIMLYQASSISTSCIIHDYNLQGHILNNIYVMDFDKIDHIENILHMVQPQMSSEVYPKIILQSTPYKRTGGISEYIKNPQFHTTVVNYNVIKNHDYNYYNFINHMKYIIGDESFAQEFDMTPHINDIMK